MLLPFYESKFESEQLCFCYQCSPIPAVCHPAPPASSSACCSPIQTQLPGGAVPIHVIMRPCHCRMPPAHQPLPLLTVTTGFFTSCSDVKKLKVKGYSSPCCLRPKGEASWIVHGNKALLPAGGGWRWARWHLVFCTYSFQLVNGGQQKARGW